MKLRPAAALVLWYLLIPPVFSPMGQHHLSFNDLRAPLSKWDILGKFDSQAGCEKEKEHVRSEAPARIRFAREHPDQDPNENILAVSEAWQMADCVAANDPRLNARLRDEGEGHRADRPAPGAHVTLAP